jgi:HlyD family secretion protein/epimerase transport system membrane fusion protein
MSNVLPLYRTPPAPAVEAPYPTSCTKTITFGLVVIAVAFGGFGGWAGLAPLSSAAIAPGTVVVDSSRKSVQHLEGGVIREILVRDGDLVEAGEVLVRLDGAGVRAAIASLQPMLATNEAQRARLQAERQGLDQIPFPHDLLADAAATTPQILAGQQRVFDTRRNALMGEKALNANRLAQSRQRLEGLERQRRLKQAELALLRDELANLDVLLSKGYATRKVVSAGHRSFQQLQSEYTDLDSKANEARMLVERYELEGIQIGRNFGEQVENELYVAEKEYYQLLERMRAIQDQHARLDIRAPTSGVVVNMVAHTVGGVIAPGSPIMDIVPKNDQLMIEAQVRPSDVDGVSPGLPADVRFPAFNSVGIPQLTGTVSVVSADRLTSASGAAYFLVRVAVSESELARLQGLTLIPGMPAEVLINKNERTLLQYLLSPLTHSVWTAFRE